MRNPRTSREPSHTRPANLTMAVTSSELKVRCRQARLHRLATTLRRTARAAYEVVAGPRPFEVTDDRPLNPDVNPVQIPWPTALRRPLVGLVRDRDRPPYWTKYQRFLETNCIPFQYFDPERSTWFESAASFDVILWRIESPPAKIVDARRKIHLLETVAGKLCYPRSFTAHLYEDKLMQWELLRSLGHPAIETFYSTSYNQSLDFVRTASYPLVSKTASGSASTDVHCLPNRRAGEALVKRAFSLGGVRTYWPYSRQHGYVLLQPLLPNDGYDLRVIVIGRRTFGYYRDVPAGDFRASGHSPSRKQGIPRDALDLGRAIADDLDQEWLAVDLMRLGDGSLRVIELSAFTRVTSPQQLVVAGTPGAYVHSNDAYEFVPGEFWPQELALEQFFQRRWFPRAAAADGSRQPLVRLFDRTAT